MLMDLCHAIQHLGWLYVDVSRAPVIHIEACILYVTYFLVSRLSIPAGGVLELLLCWPLPFALYGIDKIFIISATMP